MSTQNDPECVLRHPERVRLDVQNSLLEACKDHLSKGGMRWTTYGTRVVGPDYYALSFIEETGIIESTRKGGFNIWLEWWGDDSLEGKFPLPKRVLNLLFEEFGKLQGFQEGDTIYGFPIPNEVEKSDLLRRIDEVLLRAWKTSEPTANPKKSLNWNEAVSQVQALSEKQTLLCGGPNPSDLSVRTLKLMEESGELAQAILRLNGSVNASKSAPPNADDAAEEAVDVIICGLDIAFRLGLTPETLQEVMYRKMKKWGGKLDSSLKTKE